MGDNIRNFDRYRSKQVLIVDFDRDSSIGCNLATKSEKKENQENLDAKSFLNPDLTPPSLDDPDPRGNNEATTGAAEEAVSFIASSATLQLLLRHVLCRRLEMFVAFDVFAAIFVE
ncbi:hypothetical protein BHE74_00039082 [Ensete ventricosum]|nr:hypothetical protein BHE74_00039082 [Ensete ventricosum]